MKQLDGGNYKVLKKFNSEIRRDPEIAIEAIKRNENAVSEVIGNFRDNEEVIIEAINQSPFNFQYASDRLQEDQKIVSIAMKKTKERIAEIEEIREISEREGYPIFKGSNNEYELERLNGQADYLAKRLQDLKKDDEQVEEKTELEQKDEEATALAEEEADLDKKLEQARALEEEYKSQLPEEQEIDDTEHEDK